MSTTRTNLRNAGGNWIIGTVAGLEVQAKAYDEPSHYGMTEDGRISKLFVKFPGKGGPVVYSYDRNSLDVAHMAPLDLAAIVGEVVRHIDGGPIMRACGERACIRPFDHKGDHVFKPCARAGCTNRARNIDERFCTQHEDRKTYERYEAAAGDTGAAL